MMKQRIWTAGAAALALGTGALAAWHFPAPKAEAACCYFAAQEKDINQPGQKAFVTWDPDRKVESFTVQPKFEGNALDFGMVIPTPAQPKLDEMPRDFFRDLAIYTILLPLPYAIELTPPAPTTAFAMSDGVEEGKADDPRSRHGVRVLEAGVVGSLDYKIIEASRAAGLYDWLKENQYVYSGNEETLDFYIKKKWLFTVMKIDTKQMKRNSDGTFKGDVTPTRFTFESETCVYPLKITQISVKSETDALFYVQSPEQLDLDGSRSWMPSYRVMWLTYMQGCSITPEQQTELNDWEQWIEKQSSEQSGFTTTKLEWAKKLGDGDLALLDDPVHLWPQGGGVPLAAGDEVISVETFLREAREFLKTSHPTDPEFLASRLKELEKSYTPLKGDIVRVAHPEASPIQARYVFYPKRDAPEDDLKGLARLKGHLKSGQWLTKFRRILRKEEMTDDLLMVPVPKGREQEYLRIMPTSPP